MTRARTLLPLSLILLGLAAASAASAAPLPLPLLREMPGPLRSLARARMHTHTSTPATLSRFELESNDGYHVVVGGSGNDVLVEVYRGDLGSLSAYVTRGTVAPNRIEASFGDLGRISVRFRPSGHVRKSRPRQGCRGPNRFTTRLGVFTGEIRFAGEDDYLGVAAHRARGQVRSPLELRCAHRGGVQFGSSGSSGSGGSGGGVLSRSKLGFLDVAWRHAVTSTSFLALKGLLGSRVLYLAVAEQSVGRVATLRYAFASGPGKSFFFDDALTRAGVSPPAPFSGSGDFRAAADGTKTWTGPLVVSFPGAPRVPLTGPQFKVDLQVGF